MHQVLRKKGRGGGSGKAVAPHPDELIGVSPPKSLESSKPGPGSGRKTIDLLKNRAGRSSTSSCPSQDKPVAAAAPPGKRTIDLLKLRASKSPFERSISPVPGQGTTLPGKKPPSTVVKCVKPEVSSSGSVGSTVTSAGSDQGGYEVCQREQGRKAGGREEQGRKVVKEEIGKKSCLEEVEKRSDREEGRKSDRVVDQGRFSERKKGGGGGGALFSGDLHARLALLEDRVTQLAGELKNTKAILHANNPASNQLLVDIQSKISNIEKAIVSRGFERKSITTSCGLSQESTLTIEENCDSEGRSSNSVSMHESLLTAADEFLASLKYTQGAGAASKFIDMKPLPLKGCGDLVEKVGGGGVAEKRRRQSLGDNRSSGSYQSANSDEGFEALAGLECDEVLSQEVAEDQENSAPIVDAAALELPIDEMDPDLIQIGTRSALAGWFVCEADGMLLTYDDGSCSFYDVANMEEKTNYKLPEGLTPSTWRDCWLVRAAGIDGRSCKYVVTASAGTAVDPAFCSWNFYEKTVAAYRSENLSWPTTPGSNSSPESRRSSKEAISVGSTSRSSGSKAELEFPLWWYRPCGALIACGGSGLKTITIYDIRDGERVMKWDSNRCLSSTMSYSSPVQWSNRSTLLTVEDGGVSAWDVSNAEAKCIHNVDLGGAATRAVHVYNAGGECNGGVRQRISTKDIDGIAGVVATHDAVSILDFRVPSGVGVKIPLLGQDVHSLYADASSLYAAGTIRSQCIIQQWSIRKGQPMMLYSLPTSASSHPLQTQITQVWGDDKSVMAVNGNGLFVFDSSTAASCPPVVIGTDDLYCPTFDYSGSKLLLVSRDRPAAWQYWPAAPLWTLW